MPDPGVNPPSSAGPGPGENAAEALRAAEQAVNNLKKDTTPGVAASGGDASAASALAAAQEAIAAAKAASGPLGDAIVSNPTPIPEGANAGVPGTASPQTFGLPAFGASAPPAKPEGIDLLSDVNLNVKIELGRTRMLVEDVLRLGEGSVVELDKLAGDPVDVYVNERHVARGEVLVLNDNFCVRINEIVAAVGDVADSESPRAGRGRR